MITTAYLVRFLAWQENSRDQPLPLVTTEELSLDSYPDLDWYSSLADIPKINCEFAKAEAAYMLELMLSPQPRAEDEVSQVAAAWRLAGFFCLLTRDCAGCQDLDRIVKLLKKELLSANTETKKVIEVSFFEKIGLWDESSSSRALFKDWLKDPYLKSVLYKGSFENWPRSGQQ